MSDGGDANYNPYKSGASQLQYGLLYKLDKFCARCRTVDWHGAVGRLQQQRTGFQRIPLYDRPVLLRDQRVSCEFCWTVNDALRAHPELREYFDHVHKCRRNPACHERSHVLDKEPVLVSLCDLDGDYNVEVRISAVAYRNAAPASKGQENPVKKAEGVSGGLTDNFAIARHWLEDCARNHEACCTRSEEPKLPSRVIDVQSISLGGNPEPRLVITNGMHGRYSTISYVWGEGAHVTTTLAEVEDLCREIKMYKLPQLFQDAILTTRHLGIPYLWIDAVCIVQDVPDDVQRELSGMSDIYYNSTLTLAAAGQRNVHNNLMRQRNPHFKDIHGTPSVHDDNSDFFFTFLPFGHPAGLT